MAGPARILDVPPAPCPLAPGSRFAGLFAFRGAARVEGRLEGRVVAQGLFWVGEQASVKAVIEADTVVVAGELEGEIRAHARVQLLESARVRATIQAPRVRVAEGARLEGRMHVAPEDGSESPAVEGERLGNSRVPG